MSRWRVTITRIGVYEVEAPDADQAGRVALAASFSDPGPHKGAIVIEAMSGNVPAVELDLSKMTPQGSA